MSGDKKNVPALRFKGFTDDWEHKKLGEIAKFRRGKGYKKDDIKKEGTPFIHYGLLYTNYESVIKNIETFVEEEVGSVKSKGNDLLIPSSGETDLEIARASTLINKGVILGGDLNVLNFHSDFSSSFFAFQFSNPFYRNKISKLAQGNSVVHLYSSDLKLLKLNVPLLGEQKRISNFFEHLDSLIELYQRKLDNLKSLKREYLKLTFTNNNSNPILRFKEFTDVWEQRFYSSAFNNFVYGIGASAKNYDGKYKYLRITDIDEEKRTINFDNLKSPDAPENDLKKYILKENDIVFARTGASVGKSYLFDSSYQNVVFAGYLIRGEVSEEYNSEFIFLQSLRESFKRYIEVISMRSGQPGINPSELGNFKFNAPKIQEQKKISSLLSQLDKIITLYQHEINNLLKIKKIYLQKLFV